MATFLNRVTAGNDITLKVKVGMVQYDNNTIDWTYLDLTQCSNITFNISCLKHNVNIDLDYVISEEDNSVITAEIKAEKLHENSIYNFTISGYDSKGYHWTYISPKTQSFYVTAYSEDSAAAYTELAFTAGMILPLAAQGRDGFTPYIGENNNWWINGQDTGVSAIANVDLSDYATISYVSEAINNIDIPQVDLTGYATEAYVTNVIENIPQVDLSSYATISYVSDAINNIDIPQVDLTGYATEAYVSQAISDIPQVDLTGYATEAYVSQAISEIPGVDLTGYATEAYVTNAIENIDIPQVDLTGYATEAYVSQAISEIPGVDLTGYATEAYVSQAISEIPGVDLTGYATEAYVTNAIENIDIPQVDLTSYATQSYVTNAINNIDITGSAISACGALIDKTNIINSMLNANGDTSQFQNIYFIDFDNATRNNGYNREIILYNGSIVEAVKIGEEETPFNTGNHVDIIRLRFYSRAEQCYKEIVYGMDMYDHGNPFNYYMTSLEVGNFEYLTNVNADGYIDVWGAVNQIYAHYDCSQAIDKILNGDTITTGWDIQNLWEVTFNHDTRKAQPVYKNSPVSWYIDKDDNYQTLKTYYHFWNRDDNKYYNITVQWTYLGDDTSSALLEQAILSATFTTEEYATTAYVTAAVSGITPGGGGGSVDLTGYATEAYVTNAINNIDFTPYVTNSYLTAYYSTTDDILTEIDTTISDVTTVEGEQWVKHDYQLMRYECNRIRFYDYLYSDSQPVTCYGFKIGIVNEANVDLYNITANSNFDDEVEIHTWYRMIPKRAPQQYDYVYEITSIDSDNSVKYNYLIQDGEDEFGHYVDITLIDDGNDGIVYFGPKISNITRGTDYTDIIDGQTITITNSSGSSLVPSATQMVEHGYLLDFVYGSITAAENINNHLSQLWANNKFATKSELSNYISWNDAPATITDLSGVTLQLVTETQYNDHITNNSGMENTLYIIVDDNDINVVKQMRVYEYHWDPIGSISPYIDGYSGWDGESDLTVTDSSWDSTPWQQQ